MKKKPRAIPTPGDAKRTRPLPHDLNVDDRRNWNFDGVPDIELAACCLWEYARESASVRAECRRWAKNPDPMLFGMAEIERMGRLGDMLFEGYFGSEPMTQFPKPWQGLPEETKAECVKVFGEHSEPISFPMSQAIANALHVRAKEYRREWEKTAPRLPASSPVPRNPSFSIIGEDNGKETLMLTIDWGHCRTEDIAAAFKQWAEKNRPRCFRKPKGRPHGTVVPKAALRCLAIMRVLRDHPPAEVSEMFDKLYQSCNKKHFRDAERAVTTFQKMLQLPKGEVPLSWRKR